MQRSSQTLRLLLPSALVLALILALGLAIALRGSEVHAEVKPKASGTEVFESTDALAFAHESSLEGREFVDSRQAFGDTKAAAIPSASCPTSIIELLVRDEHDSPVSDAELLLGRGDTLFQLATRTDAAGRARIRVASAHALWATVRVEGRLRGPLRRVTVRDGATLRLAWSLREQRLQLFRDAKVVNSAASPSSAWRRERGCELGYSPTRMVRRGDGVHVLRGDPRGPRELRPVRPSSVRHAAPRSLAHGARTAGEVLHPVLGPVADVRIEVRDQGGAWRRTTSTDERGLFELEDLAPGDWRLRAHHASLGSSHSSVHIEAGEALEWSPVLDPGSIISGNLGAADGAPLAHWIVVATATGAEAWSDSAWTDERGHFVIAELPAGPYDLSAHAPAGSASTALASRADVWAGGAELHWRLSSAEHPRASLLVSCAPDLRVLEVRMDAAGAEQCTLLEGAASEGELRARDLAPGRYRLTWFDAAGQVYEVSPVDLVEGDNSLALKRTPETSR